MKIILITGVSSGTGFGLAGKFLESGFQVIGNVRRREKAGELQKRFGKNFRPLVFDILSPDEVSEAADHLALMLGENKLTALVNNAGTAEIGPLLHVSLEDLRKHLDTLVVGQLCVIQRFFPFLVSDSGPPARIYNISSVSGEGVNLLFGCYAAGKHALEGLSKTLREELKPYGIKVIVVAPGNIATPIWKKQTRDKIVKYKNTAYYPLLKNAIQKFSAGLMGDAMTIEEFAEAFMKIFRDKEPADRYTIIKPLAEHWSLSGETPLILKK